ncbi:poly-beta-1,6 N-acetyl-D-glucosamine export porin PgaA [Atlantibacter hermannii]|uniref:poly-beta-1,6 N-acetyl-D-glucosamine export porin PgaA n=1 Tax=Atlantibacter hermannii TaxID=565 RepID=UPI00289713CA|nr:poly-beta-1,6 N-acetyl-D-glucosamine export porin PgaA [Atlantibacter hermannii]
MRTAQQYKKIAFRQGLRASCALGLWLFFPLIAHATDTQYDQLIIQAREGNTRGLLDYLQTQEQQNELNANQVADWLQVAGWAGNDAEVSRVWQRYHTRMDIPTRGVAAAARAYRNQKQWNTALSLWEQARQAEPNNDDLRVGWVMTLADAKQNYRALQEAEAMLVAEPSAKHYQLLAYVYRSQGKSWDTLFATTRAEGMEPSNAELEKSLLGTLSANRISGPALTLSQSAAISPQFERALEADAAAELVRMSFTSARSENERFVVADKALARYDVLLNKWKDDPAAAPEYRRARIDRIGALLSRNRFSDAIAEYESLQADGKPVPDYARRWAASAYLADRKPQQAQKIFSEIFSATDPVNLPMDDEQDLFYAYMESENYDLAQREVGQILQKSPYQRHFYGSPTPGPNDKWLLGRMLLVQYEVMTNDLAAAEKLSHNLARSAPGNQELLINYASVLDARGLPRAAERELKIAEALEPANLELERQQAYVAQDLQEWRQMDLLTDDVVARSPEDPATQRLDRVREVHHKSELRISGTQGINSDSPVSGSHDFTLNSALYGPPMGDNWRLFAGFNYANSEFEEGKGITRDALGGVEWRARDYWIEAALSNRNFNGENKLGARLSGWHDFNDNWRVGGSAERLSQNTPLRAMRNGVTANGGNAFIRWYQNERREYQLSVAPSWFSDGNNRVEYALSGKERMFTRPNFTLDFTPSLSGSVNSKENASYYNPKRDASLTPAVMAEHVMYRNYETVWSQQLEAGVGAYWQKNYDTGLITQVGYGQRLQLNNVFDAGVMLTWDKRPYDGKREQNLGVAFDMNLRF